MSEARFNQLGRDVSWRRNVAFIGDFTKDHNYRSISGVVSHPQSAQTTTITVPASPDANADYKITENGSTATFATGGATTQLQLGEGLVAQFNATPGLYRRWVASYTGGVLTLTGKHPGIAGVFTVNSDETTNDLGTPNDTVLSATAEIVEFGLMCRSEGFVTDEGNEKVYVPTASDFTAQVLSFTFAGDTASYYTGNVRVNGKSYPWGGVVWTTDLDTTCGLIADAINAVLPANTVLAASVGGGGGVVTLTAEVAGAKFDADAYATGHASAEATKAETTGPDTSTSFVLSAAGISVRRLDVEDRTYGGDDPAYKANSTLEVAVVGRGALARVLTETWVARTDAYVSVATADKGTTHNAAGAERIWFPPSMLQIGRQEPSTQTNGIGFIKLNLGV